jgi:hypothetical protein
LAMLTIRSEIRRLEHTQQPSDVRRTTIDVPLGRDKIAGWRQRSVRGRAVGDLLR